jgi:hydroxymethylbilane synthase
LAALTAERAVVTALEATCNTPIGAYARLGGAPLEGGTGGAPREDDTYGGPREDGRRGTLRLTAFVGLPDGSHWIRDELNGDPAGPAALGSEVAQRMQAAGARELLADAERAAGARA